MTDLSQRIANLSPEKRELLQRRLHKQQEASPIQITPIPRDTNTFPLSFAQQRLWFLNQIDSNSSFYNIPAAVNLKGKLNIAALERSLNEVLRRHEALRTNLIAQEGQPVQIIHPTSTFTLPVFDLREFDQSEQETEVWKKVKEETQHSFDLSQSLLVRATLLQISVEEHVLLLTMHHIVSDGWSMAVFIREMAALYAAFTSESSSPLPELPIQYVDFAHWQRQWLQGEVLQQQLSYWKQQLDNTPTVLEIPTDRPRSPIQTFRGAHHSFTISSSLSKSIKTLSQREGTTLFMTLLAAFNVLLYRYSGQEDIVIGSPVANRNRGETEGLIGFFVNTLVLRTQLHGNPSFQELLARVREVALGAYAHQDLPFEKLVEELQVVRDLSRNPLFQVMFILQNAPTPALELGNLSLSLLDIDQEIAKFDLTLTLEETANGIAGNFEYNTDLFDAATIERMVGHFQTLLAGIVASPKQHLAELPLLTATEQHQLLVEWNNTQVNYPRDICIHHLFAEQVEKTPDAIALIFENERLTYQELNYRANCLAHHLQKLGVKSDVLVGIYMERSLEIVVAILGILKAGGAYLPLDPAFPQERLDCMLADAKVPVLLTQQQLLEKLPNFNASVVCLDTDWQIIQGAGEQNLQTVSLPNNLAYTIYTSGSTGKPKGVMVTHRNVVNFFTGMDKSIGDDNPGTWLAVTSISFDISVLELLWTLTRGFQVVINGESIRATNNTEENQAITEREMAFSLFYFANDEAQAGTDKYKLLLEGAKFADKHGFSAIWTPERHFHAFGGLYPNPSVVSAAIATITERIQIRAGSIGL
jgi:non-ribosomal peptide synthetase component F